MSPTRHELVLPDLGFSPTTEVMVSLWLVECGATVAEGDRLLEVVAGCATIDLPSPATGTVWKMLVEEDDPLTIGQVLAIIEANAGHES